MEALQLGAWDYISKPFSPDAIRNMVKKVLGHARSPATPRFW